MIAKKLPDPSKVSHVKSAPLFSDHYIFTQKIITSYHCPEYFTGLGIIAILKGKGVFRVNGQKIRLDRNSFLVINRGSRLSMELSEIGTHPVLLFFNTTLSAMAAQNLLINKPEDFGPHGLSTFLDFSLVEHIHYKNAALASHISLLMELSQSCSSFHALKADMLIRNILDHLINKNYSAIKASSRLEVIKRSTRTDLYKRLSLAKDWMEKYYHHPITVSQIADIAMLNRHHFLRVFKQAFQTTPYQHLRDIRIKQAKKLLTTTDKTVSEICHSTGFESLSSFSWLFRQSYGVPPTHFRRKSSLT